MLFTLYLLTILPLISQIASVFTLCFITFITLVALCCFMDEKPFILKGKLYWWKVIFAVSLTLSLLIPSKQDIYILIGTYIAIEVVDSDTGQDVIKLIRQKIKSELGKE